MRKFTLCVLGAAMTLGMYAQARFQSLYVVGSACSAGWSQDGALPMEKTADGLFVWTGELKAAVSEDVERFKFLVDEKQWAPTITCDINTPEVQHQMVELADASQSPIKENKLYVRETENTGSDNAFTVSETATYTIAINLEAMKMVVVKGTEPIYPTVPTLDTDSLYLVGGAVNATGEWDHSLPPVELTGENGVFTFNDTLYTNAKDSAEFKFKTKAYSWDETLVSAVEGGQAIAAVEGEDAAAVEYDMVFRPFEGSPNDFPFLITATGVYDLTIDLNTKKLTVNSFTPVEEEGNNAVAMVSEDVVRVLAAANTITLSAQGDNVITSASVYDVAGKCLGTVSESGSQVWFEGLSNGLYIVKMNCAGKDYVQKVLVK